MSRGERFVVLGLAPVRSDWFRDVGRWANEAAIPVDFLKTISVNEVMTRLESRQPFSALLIDASSPGLDRDLLELASSVGCAAIVVDHGLVDRNWRELGARAVLPERFDSGELLVALSDVAQPISRAEADHRIDPVTEPLHVRAGGRTVAVTGSGGIGTSTIAMALTQGLAQFPEHRTVLLADMALRSSQAMQHDVRDLVPGLTELVDAHRLGVPADEEISASIFDLPDRGYHLLLGLRHERDWMTVSGRALSAAWRSIERLYQTTVADVTAEFDGVDETGSGDIEDRNRLARVAARRADVVVVVGEPGAWGMHRLVRTIVALSEVGVDVSRILPCINRAPRQPRLRAGISGALADLVDTRVPDAGTMPNPVFCPSRKQLESLQRDAEPLPASLVDPVTGGVRALMATTDIRTPDAVGAMPEPIAIVPGSLGTWSDDDG